MAGLTPLGTFHTVVSVIALVAGFAALAADREISLKSRAGQTYLVATAITCLTALGIFRHGTFGPPHGLAIITLAALGAGIAASTTAIFGRAGRYVQTICFSATLFFSLIPAFTETLTRVPASAPLLPGPDSPVLQVINLILLVLFIGGVALQIRRLRGQAVPAL